MLFEIQLRINFYVCLKIALKDYARREKTRREKLACLIFQLFRHDEFSLCKVLSSTFVIFCYFFILVKGRKNNINTNIESVNIDILMLKHNLNSFVA